MSIFPVIPFFFNKVKSLFNLVGNLITDYYFTFRTITVLNSLTSPGLVKSQDLSRVPDKVGATVNIYTAFVPQDLVDFTPPYIESWPSCCIQQFSGYISA